MPGLFEVIRNGAALEGHRPWPRFAVDARSWTSIAQDIADGHATLLSHWAEAGGVHMAVMTAAHSEIAVFSLDCPQGRFPSVAAVHAPAIRLERTILDLFGLVAEGAPDERPWLDHGRWGVKHPL